MSQKNLSFKIVGVSPLVMHNGQLADPLNDYARALKRVSSKKLKTDADHEELSRLEWYGGLYLDSEKPCIPDHVMEAVLIESARKTKRGKQAQAGLICPHNFVLTSGWDGTPEEMWKSGQHVLRVLARVGTVRIMRTRPIFRDWSATIEIAFDDELLNADEIGEIVQRAGEVVGVCDWRPKFGRYSVEQ